MLIGNVTKPGVQINRFTVDNNCQATWLSGNYNNLKTFMDANANTLSWQGRSTYGNVVNELNHQHIYAEVDTTDDEALSQTYIGYPVAWLGRCVGNEVAPIKPSEFTDGLIKDLLTPLPQNWKIVKNKISR